MLTQYIDASIACIHACIHAIIKLSESARDVTALVFVKIACVIFLFY